MKNNMLKTLGIMVLGATVLVAVVVGRGKEQTADVPTTEVIEATVETEVVEETEAAPEATEEVVVEDTEVVEETEVAEATEVAEEPAYTITEMNATKYAKSSVNVRDLPNTDGNRVGGLSTNQQVKVTGQCVETGWYQIELNGTVAYVSDSYLVDQKVAVTSTPSASTGNTSASTGTATNNATSTQNQSAASGTTATQTQTPAQNTATQSQPTTPETSTPAPTPTPEQPPVADTNTNTNTGTDTSTTPETGSPSFDSGSAWGDFDNSGTTVTGDQAQQLIDGGAIEAGAATLNPDGSVTIH